MKKILLLLLFVSVFVIVTFLLFADFEVFVENNLHEGQGLATYIGLSFIFLFSDILFPIPSSLIMMLNGKVLGAIGGSLLSFCSGMASSALGYYLGKRSSKYIDRFFKPEEIEAGNRYFDKYGSWSVALSRAIPIISESVTVVAGTTRMPFRSFMVYAAIGQVVISVIYAVIGYSLVEWSGHIVTVVIVLSTLLLTWLIAAWLKRREMKQTRSTAV